MKALKRSNQNIKELSTKHLMEDNILTRKTK